MVYTDNWGIICHRSHPLREPETTIDDVTYTLRPLIARKKGIWFGCGPPPRMHSLARFWLGNRVILVNCWFGARWFGFLESPYERDYCITWVHPYRIPNHQFSICKAWLKKVYPLRKKHAVKYLPALKLSQSSPRLAASLPKERQRI